MVCHEDTQVLLSLAGIRSVRVTPDTVQQAYEQACTDSNIAILAVSQALLPQLAQQAGTNPVIVPLYLE